MGEVISDESGEVISDESGDPGDTVLRPLEVLSAAVGEPGLEVLPDAFGDTDDSDGGHTSSSLSSGLELPEGGTSSLSSGLELPEEGLCVWPDIFWRLFGFPQKKNCED